VTAVPGVHDDFVLDLDPGGAEYAEELIAEICEGRDRR
jgi:hypothetical protein